MVHLICLISLVVCGMSAHPSRAATIANPDFETGNLNGWATKVSQMSVAARTNETFNRNYAAAITGQYCSATWITNAISQTFNVIRGDNITVEGYLYWKSYSEQLAAATGYVQAVITGDFHYTQTTHRAVWPATNGWKYFKLENLTFGVLNSGYEVPWLANWAVSCDHLTAYDFTNSAASDDHCMRMVGSFTNWSWNQVYQVLQLKSGEVVSARAKMKVDLLQTSGDWLVAGIKIERDGAPGQSQEHVLSAPANTVGQWTELSFTMACTQTGAYVYRTMVAGGANGVSQADVYFDDVSIRTTNIVQPVTLQIAYLAHSGGPTVTSTAAIYLDALTMKGSSADVVTPTNMLTILRNEALTIGTNSAAWIPEVNYPKLNAYGDPSSGRFPGSVEAAFVGRYFKRMTNAVAVKCTNTISLYNLSTNGSGYLEIDQYIYCGKNPHKKHGELLEISTNAPYFTLGTKNSSSSEFGNGPFAPMHTYVVGTSLTNFPRRLSTDGAGGWPRAVNIVFTENFSLNTNALWNRHFVINGVITNGSQTGVKAVRIALYGSNSGVSNDLAAMSQEIHMGWASEVQSYGLVDYPNVTYQDHNEVSLRSPWINNLVDDSTGWYMQQTPRGSATIEPLDLFALDGTNWVQRMYDETLFLWPHAASGIRSIFDDDEKIRLRGQASYHVGFKIGHQFGTNEYGEANYPEVLNIRGNGYFRMTDYGGVMAGSFRPMASDVFGLYKGKANEDSPLITKSYARIVPRTNPTNDNSYGQIMSAIRSKTNQFFIGCMKTDAFFTPELITTNGCYFNMEAETWAHRANIVTQHGPFALFSQVSMHWRGGSNINDGAEGHDIDCVMLKKTNGEWITHQVLNPPTNVFHRTLGAVQSNDTIYLMQQDRGRDSYGFATESPYKKASSFEITMLNNGGLPLSLDVYEEHADSEINDNINITCNVTTSIVQAQKLNYNYRYRAIYGPGVYIINPNEPSGGVNWSTDVYRIEFYATDGDDMPMVANIYYGNGKDGDWRLINTNAVLTVPIDTHRVEYDWNTANVAAGAYYIKVVAQRTMGGKYGFDVSNTRLQIGRTVGFIKNGTSTNYWLGTSAINVTNHNVLSIYVRGLSGVYTSTIWVTDAGGVSATLPLTNYVSKVLYKDQRVDIPWSRFTAINKTQIKAIGFSTTNLIVSRLRSIHVPLVTSTKIGPRPQANEDGLWLYDPGTIMTNVITLTNMTAVAQTGLTVQVVQESAETLLWWDASPHVPARWSERVRRGDRLVGDFEQVWVNQTIPASGKLVLTNRYQNPAGRLVATNYYGSNSVPWTAFLNEPGCAQVHVVVRKANGDNLYDNEGAGYYGVRSSFTNRAPVASNQAITVSHDVAKAITLIGSDIDTNYLSYAVVNSPTKGSLSGSAPYLIYTVTNGVGVDSFTFRTADGLLTSAVATVSITVVQTNDPPVASNQIVVVTEDTAKAIVLGARDPETNAMSFVVSTLPVKGSLTGAPPNLTYRPFTNYIGSDSFTFRATDSFLTSEVATVSITISNVNDVPTANPQSVLVYLQTPKVITLDGSDPETNSLTYSVVVLPAKGVLSGVAPNLTYTPTNGAVGLDSFTFKVSDYLLTSAVATVSITIGTNSPPVALPQSVVVPVQTPWAITLVGSDPGGDPLTYTVVSLPTKGTLSGLAPNLTYTPTNGALGATDSFTFRVSDGPLTSSVAAVSIRIASPLFGLPAKTGEVFLVEHFDFKVTTVDLGVNLFGGNIGGVNNPPPTPIYTNVMQYWSTNSVGGPGGSLQLKADFTGQGDNSFGGAFFSLFGLTDTKVVLDGSWEEPSSSYQFTNNYINFDNLYGSFEPLKNRSVDEVRAAFRLGTTSPAVTVKVELRDANEVDIYGRCLISQSTWVTQTLHRSFFNRSVAAYNNVSMFDWTKVRKLSVIIEHQNIGENIYNPTLSDIYIDQIMLSDTNGVYPNIAAAANPTNGLLQVTYQNAFLDYMRGLSFLYFMDYAGRDASGSYVVQDRSNFADLLTVGGVGFQIPAYVIGSDCAYITRTTAAARVQKILTWLDTAPSGPDRVGVTGYNGLYYHFLGPNGLRKHNFDVEATAEDESLNTVELSAIDTSLALAGILTARQYFNQTNAVEADIRTRALSIYNRVNWPFLVTNQPDGNQQLIMAWKPVEFRDDFSGRYGSYQIYDSQGYGQFASTKNLTNSNRILTLDYYTDEALLMALLAMGSENPTYKLNRQIWDGIYRVGPNFVMSWPGSLFTYQFWSLFVDSKKMASDNHPTRPVNFFTNQLKATSAARQFAMTNAVRYPGLIGSNAWGFSAAEGPFDAYFAESARPLAYGPYLYDMNAEYGVGGDGYAVPRNNAFSLYTRWLSVTGNNFTMSFNIPESSNLQVVVRYSNDGGSDQIKLELDNNLLGLFNTVDTRLPGGQPGSGWNEFQISPLNTFTGYLAAGKHDLKVTLMATDAYGVEIDMARVSVSNTHVSGTMCVYAMASSMVQNPQESIDALWASARKDLNADGKPDLLHPRFGIADSYNMEISNAIATVISSSMDTLPNALRTKGPWMNQVGYAIDQGPMVIAIDNYLRTNQIPKLFMSNPGVKSALQTLFPAWNGIP